MPVSKKRKKEGKPVQRREAATPAHEGSENPFVKNTSQVRGAQRGR